MYLFWKKYRCLLNQWVTKPYTVSDNMFVEKYYEEQMCFSLKTDTENFVLLQLKRSISIIVKLP